MLRVNEIFPSIQGEGAYAGQATVFVRLSGCNLRCSFCDTTYAYDEGKDMLEPDIVSECLSYNIPSVCLTGGEPLIQDVTCLVKLLHKHGMVVSVETNGTQPIPYLFDHVTVSPKHEPVHCTARAYASEWKYVIQDESDFEKIEQREYVYLQPVDNDMEIAKLCVQKILERPEWRLSLQLHKLIGIR